MGVRGYVHEKIQKLTCHRKERIDIEGTKIYEISEIVTNVWYVQQARKDMESTPKRC